MPHDQMISCSNGFRFWRERGKGSSLFRRDFEVLHNTIMQLFGGKGRAVVLADGNHVDAVNHQFGSITRFNHFGELPRGVQLANEQCF